MIKFRCPSCQTKLGVPDEYAGRRIRCNKCGQPAVVPKPITEVTADPTATPKPVEMPVMPTPPVRVQTQHAANPQKTQQTTLPDNPLDEIQDDPNTAILRQARQNKLASEKIKSPAAKSTKTAARSPSSGKPDTSFTLTDYIPDILHFPLSLVLSVLLMIAVIFIWIVRSRAAHSPLGFMAVFVFLGAGTGIRLLSVNHTFIAGVLAMILGVFGFVTGRVAVAKYVGISLMQQQAHAEVLTRLPALLSDPRLQFPQNESINTWAKNSGFMTCAALVAAVDQDDVDPVVARKIAMPILRESTRNLIEMLGQAGSTSARPTAPKVTASTPEEELQQQQALDKAWPYMERWTADDSEARAAARKYYPAVACMMEQTNLLKILEDPKRAFNFALMMTFGFLDLAWAMIGLTASYMLASLEI